MENRVIESLLVWVMASFALWGLGLLIAWLDYSLNKSLIDVIKFTQFEWWHFLTYRHWWAWLYANDLISFLYLSFIVCGVIGAVIAFIWYFREWD